MLTRSDARNSSSPTTTPPIPNPPLTVTETTETGTETENACERERAREAKCRNREREDDVNSLYQIPHEAHLLFGCSFRAGMDRHEQKKLVAKNGKDMCDQIRKKDDIMEKPEEADAQRHKEGSAELYDTFDIRIDQHWSEKKLEEMTKGIALRVELELWLLLVAHIGLLFVFSA